MTARIRKRFLKLLHKILKMRVTNMLLLPVPSTVDNIIKASNYSDINKLSRVTALL